MRVDEMLAFHRQFQILDRRVSEARFRVMVENSAIGIILTTLDGHLLRANPADEWNERMLEDFIASIR